MAILPAALPGSGWHAIGPYGGAAEIIRVSSADPDVVIAASRHAIFKSINAGSKWVQVRTPADPSCVVHTLEFDPGTSSRWYAGMECGGAPAQSGLYRSLDAGESWSVIRDLSGNTVWSLAFAAGVPTRIAAGTPTGVFQSDDGGDTFRRVSPETAEGPRPVVSLAFSRDGGTTLYAGTTHLPWRSSDGGRTWQSIHAGMIDDSDVFSVDSDPRRPTVIYASACSGVYRSLSSGDHWMRLPTPQGAFRAYIVAVNPGRPDTVFAGTSAGLLRSADGGRSWLRVSSDPVRSLAFDPRDTNRMYAASPAAGLLASANGGAGFYRINSGFSNQSLSAIAGSAGMIFSIVGERSMLRTIDDGANWQAVSDLPGAPGPVWADPLHRVLIVGRGRDVYRSVDAGNSWHLAGSPPGDRVVSLAGFENTVFAATPTGVYRWTAPDRWARSALPASAGLVQQLRVDGSWLTALAQRSALVSGDQGLTWRACGPFPPGAVPYEVQVRPGSDGFALAATSRGMLRSEDGCRSWSPVTEGLTSDTVTLVYFHPRFRSVAFTAQNGRVFLSTNSGRSWTPLDDAGRLGLYPSGLTVDPANPARLYALFPGRGVLVQTIATDKLSLAGNAPAVAYTN